MRKEDIVFVINPSLWSTNMYPSGILYLSAYLEGRGLPNTILDSALGVPGLARGERERLIVEKIRQIKPRIVCFSATHREFDEVVRMNRAVHDQDPSIETIVGGAQPTYRPADFLDNGFDFVGVGEGEVTLHEFVGEVLGGERRFQNVKGLQWRLGEQIVVNPPRPLLTEAELDDIPVLPYEKLDRRYFEIDLRMIRGLPLRGALLLTTRGCPFSCSYCGCNLIFGRRLRSYSLAHIEAELQSPAALEPLLGVTVPPGWPPGEYDRSALEFFRDQLRAGGPSHVGWYGWYAITRGSNGQPESLVAGAGYLGPPSGGTVEIGYSVIPDARGRGYATELVEALTARAFQHPEVHAVIAHTSDLNVPSTRALLRCGFLRVGPGPEPGSVEYRRERTTAT